MQLDDGVTNELTTETIWTSLEGRGEKLYGLQLKVFANLFFLCFAMPDVHSYNIQDGIFGWISCLKSEKLYSEKQSPEFKLMAFLTITWV